MTFRILSVVLLLGTQSGEAWGAANELNLEKFAGSDLIKHPTGCTFTSSGDLLVIESHTHFRPTDYTGPESDQLVILKDTDGDGKADSRSVFYAENLTATMDITTHPTTGEVYVATRNEVLRLSPDGKKVERRFVFLDTTADYPHNGLSGLTFSPDGKTLYFGMGENYGADYTIRASGDDSSHSGGGEGGNIFSVSTAGTDLKRVATGFWNPFGVVCSPEGHLFATDNDPSSSPPSRLHYIINGGDYGYQFRYGRSGHHPFVSMNGELLGHLPMLAGSGEAPCDVVYKNGHLLVASWADHRLEVYPLSWNRNHFEAEQQIVFHGGKEFRPVAFAEAPSGDLFVTDWVKRDYNLHNEGAVWVLRGGWNPETRSIPTLAEASAKREAQDDWDFTRVGYPDSTGSDPDLRLIAARRKEDQSIIPELMNESPLLTLKWIADEKLESHRGLAEKIVANPPSPSLYLAAVTVLARLDDEPVDDKAIQKRVARQLIQRDTSIAVRKSAFHILPDRGKILSLPNLKELFEAGDEELKIGVLITLATHRSDQSQPFLEKVAASNSGEVSKFAKMALARYTGPGDRPVVTDRPAINADVSEWLAWADAAPGKADASRGKRIFHQPGLANCATCHQVGGYGAIGGPDLSSIGVQGREHIMRSILDPSAEIAPQYQAWQLELNDGSIHQVFMLGQRGGNHNYIDITGKVTTLSYADILTRKQVPISLMPPGLQMLLTADELRDLLAFLESSP